MYMYLGKNKNPKMFKTHIVIDKCRSTIKMSKVKKLRYKQSCLKYIYSLIGQKHITSPLPRLTALPMELLFLIGPLPSKEIT